MYFKLLALVIQGCTTNDGPDPNKPCVFPFNDRGISHSKCTKGASGSKPFPGELVILQRCQSAVLNIHAISQPIRYAFLQHLILYTFLQQQTHFRNIFYTFLKIIN